MNKPEIEKVTVHCFRCETMKRGSGDPLRCIKCGSDKEMARVIQRSDIAPLKQHEIDRLKEIALRKQAPWIPPMKNYPEYSTNLDHDLKMMAEEAGVNDFKRAVKLKELAREMSIIAINAGSNHADAKLVIRLLEDYGVVLKNAIGN